MDPLITRLAELIVQDNALLLIGASLEESESLPQAVDQIAEALAGRISYERPDRSLPAVARDFEILEGRRALIQALKEEIDRLADQPGALARQIADAVLPHSKVITSRFDQVLERSLDSSRKPYVLIVRDTDLPSFDESKITLIKMRGDIDQPDSLVITEDDIDQFLQRLPSVSDVIRAFFATKSLIFLGFDLESELFKRLYRQVSGQLSAFNRQAFAIVPKPLDTVSAKYWEKQNLALHQQDLAEFVPALTSAIRSMVEAPGEPPANPLEALADPPRPKAPYKALNSFSAADAAVFAGREIESEGLTNRILAHRVTVLYGESGSGKTSLLLAGVLPRLARRGALLVHAAPRAGQPLDNAFGETLRQAAAAAGLDPDGEPDLAGSIRRWQKMLTGPVVLAVDPFEPIALELDAAAQASDLETLNALATDRDLDLRLVLVIREDYLGLVQALENRMPGMLEARFRLERLGREAARAAIVEPAAHFGVSWASDLVERLLDELQTDPTAGVAPPQLQIVCDRLFREALPDGVPAAASTSPTITVALLERLGGVQAILSDHLEAAIGGLPDDSQGTARRLLGALVGSSGGRQRLSLADLARAAEIEAAGAAQILEHLNEQRLVQRFDRPEDDDSEYELVHDSLAGRILTWLGADFWEAQRVRETVRQALPAWEGRGRLISPDDLQTVIARVSAMRFSNLELEMIFANAVAYGAATEPWADALDPGRRLSLALDLLLHPDAGTRMRAVRNIGPLSGDQASEALASAALEDRDPGVRAAAAEAIASPKAGGAPPFDEGAVRRLGGASTEPELGARAVEALVAARDRQPNIQPALPAGIAGRVRRLVWQRRWARRRPAILAALLRGLQSGFWGVGLGLGIFLGLFNASESLGARVPIRLYLGAVLLGVSLAGVLGALAVGAGTLLQAALSALQDRSFPIRTWALTTLVSGGFFALGLVLIGTVSAGTPRPFDTLIAGLMIGLAIAGLAGLPWLPSRYPRLALTALGGIGTFLAVGYLGLFFDRSPTWLILMGLGCGVGYFFGLEPAAEPGERSP